MNDIEQFQLIFSPSLHSKYLKLNSHLILSKY